MPNLAVDGTAAAEGRRLRLSRRGTKLSTGAMERFLHRLGIPGASYSRWTGAQSFKDFIAMNPAWTQRRWEELVLENLDTLQESI